MTKHSKILTLFLAFSFVLVISGIAQLQAEETVVCAVGQEKIKKSEEKVSYEYKGKTYYFCCEGCKEKFMKNPEEYLKKKAEMKEVYTCPMHPDVKSDEPGKCPKCGMKLEKKMMHKEMMHKEHMEKEHMHMKAEEKACCPMMGVMSSKDVEMSVENIKDGIAVKITSKNADTVKKIQQMSAKMKEMCKHKEESAKKEVKKEEVKK
ncbi:MAG: YHS domain-containing protein [Candidatus Aminicenantes bacterium]|nr:YHS domain-containing protein [Candidatus Aminicenantes bacterium]